MLDILLNCLIGLGIVLTVFLAIITLIVGIFSVIVIIGKIIQLITDNDKKGGR